MPSGYEFTTNNQLQTAVDLWCSNQASETKTYGNINTLDVSNITSFYNIFSNKTNFNSDISDWDVSNGTNFSYMFYGADLFDQNLSLWDVSS